MEITTVIGCRNRCDYCPQDVLVEDYVHRSPTTRMAFEAFAACLERLPVSERIVFAGMAEPWLNPECTRMALHAHRRGHPVGVYTTLVGMGPGDVVQLREIPLGGFSVHLPSWPPQERIAVTPRYLETLEAVLGSGIAATYHSHGRETPPAVASLMRAAGVEVGFAKVHNRTGHLPIDGGKHAMKTGPIACRRHLRENALLPNGDVVLCCMDYGLRYVLGNLHRQRHADIVGGEVLQALARGLNDQMSDAPCRRCVFSVPLARPRPGRADAR